MKKALVQMNTAVLLWGFTGVLGRAITLDAPVLVWYRMLLTATFMAVIITYRHHWVRIAKQDFKTLTLVGCLMAIHWVAFYGAIKLANASIALICLSTASIFTTLTDAMMHRKNIDAKELSIGILALLGVVFMYLVPEIEKSFSHSSMVDPLPYRNWGILCGIIAAILSAIFTVFNKRIAGKYPARTMVFYEMTTGWLLISFLLPVQFLNLPLTRFVPSLWDLIWLIILSLCCTVWAQSLALSALKHISSFTATLSVNLEPLYGITLAFIFFRENQELTWSFYAGMGMIVISVLLQMLRVLKPEETQTAFVAEKSGID
ncbi:MAG: EamA family transporter [Bacteroidetes bacterium]|nr:EamA family transporter [Bacteroidota bacterium]